MSDPLPPVQVAGLLVPAEVAPEIISALRAHYPEVTEGRDDDGAVRAALIEWVTEHLVRQAEEAAAISRLQAHQQVDEQFAAQLELVRQQAHAAAGMITEAPPDPGTV